MGVHAGQLALKSDLRLVQEYRRSLLPCLEQARRPTLDHHVYRSSGLGVWVLISENWYKPAPGFGGAIRVCADPWPRRASNAPWRGGGCHRDRQIRPREVAASPE